MITLKQGEESFSLEAFIRNGRTNGKRKRVEDSGLAFVFFAHGSSDMKIRTSNICEVNTTDLLSQTVLYYLLLYFQEWGNHLRLSVTSPKVTVMRVAQQMFLKCLGQQSTNRTGK